MDPRVTPARPDLAAEHLRGKVEAARFVSGHEMVVAVPWLDMIDQPGGHLVTQLLCGDRFVVYEQGSWFAWGQNLRDGYVGYVVASHLHQPGLAANTRVSASWAHVYPRPNIKIPTDRPALPFMAALHAGDVVDGFAHVEGGFCPHQSLRAFGEPFADFVAVAEQFVGVPYFWGGCTPTGFDCSGLVQISLLATGRQVPRDTDQQAEAIGRAIGGNDAPARGDLVFWKGHVGILQSDAQIIHANAHHMAVVSEPLEAVLKRASGPVTSRRRLA